MSRATSLLLTVSAACLCVGPVAAQAFVHRDERPVRNNSIYPDGGPSGEPVAVVGRMLHRWTGGSWMPLIALPSVVSGVR